MSTRGAAGNQVNHRPNNNVSVCRKQRVARNGAFATNCGLRLPKRSELSPIRLVKRFGGKVVSMWRRSSHKGPSSTRSKPCVVVAHFDSSRTEAIEDCIEFINSSSSLPRSNSIAAKPR